ncbi:MAG TPA: hypothetical protein VGD64_09715 [Acidisarcina sp.]
MSIQISPEIEMRLIDQARREGVSVDQLLERFIKERAAPVADRASSLSELPIWHLGDVGPLHRRDIYDDAP